MLATFPPVRDIERAISEPAKDWARSCHRISYAIVASDLFAPGTCRVARGTCRGVPGQHSWIVFGDPYDLDAPILDPTLWSYVPAAPTLWTGDGHSMFRHRPAGFGRFHAGPQPYSAHKVEIIPNALTKAATGFLADVRPIACGPLDRAFWAFLLSHSNVGDTPAADIIRAAWGHPDLRPLVPADRAGMLTGLPPAAHLYLHPEDPRIETP